MLLLAPVLTQYHDRRSNFFLTFTRSLFLHTARLLPAYADYESLLERSFISYCDNPLELSPLDLYQIQRRRPGDCTRILQTLQKSPVHIPWPPLSG